MAASEKKTACMPCVRRKAVTGLSVTSQTGAVTIGSSSAGKWTPTPRMSGRPCSARLRAIEG
jgi:hypothetical protein